jgi:hypothetical protein
MKAFLAACVAIVAISVAASYATNTYLQSELDQTVGPDVRLD